MAYLGLKGILDGYNVVYASRQIDQSYTLKKRLESRRFKQGEVTCISLDVVKMYPSMQYSLLKAAVEHFTARLPRDIRDTAAVCLKMLRFGMDRTFLQYGTKYYRYTGAGSDDDPGLTIGGFESAWLADLGLSYLLQEVPSIVRATEFLEVYRDDGIVFFDGAVDKQYIHNWVSRLQSKVDTITGSSAGEHMIEFTAVYWGDDDGFESDLVTVHDEDSFPFLDMEMFWSGDDDLHFKVHLKPNQEIRYLNNDSCHRSATFAEIPRSQILRWARLTTVTDSNWDSRLDDLYPAHAEALLRAGLAPLVYPTLGEASAQVQAQEAAALLHDDDLADADDEDSAATAPLTFTPGRDTFVKIGFSRFWSVPVHVKLKELKEKYKLPWLRLRMAYHRFPNVSELFTSDLGSKVMNDIYSRNYDQLIPCSCLDAHKFREGNCVFDGDCNKYCTIYRVVCRLCGDKYIGNTQQTLKARFQDGGGSHYNVTKNHANGTNGGSDDEGDGGTGTGSTTLSSHLVPHIHIAHYPRRIGFTASHVRPLVFVDAIWEGNVISCMKTFRTQQCVLCMKERYHIFMHRWKNPDSIMNQGLSIHKGCGHNPKFHRFLLRSDDDP